MKMLPTCENPHIYEDLHLICKYPKYLEDYGAPIHIKFVF